MTQPDLFSERTDARRPEGEKKRGHVRRTSVETYQAQTARLEKRSRDVLIELNSYGIEYCHRPTSAELARWYGKRPIDFGTRKPTWLEDLLFIRRGLSDLCALGVVEVVPNGKRLCEVSRRKCETWRVRQR